jgi:hypothetical protein
MAKLGVDSRRAVAAQAAAPGIGSRETAVEKPPPLTGLVAWCLP